MRLCGKVLVAVLMLFLTAGQTWAAFCWQATPGPTVILELGQGVGSFIPVMGTLIPAQDMPTCLGQRLYPFHGIAQIVGGVALLGFTAYSEGDIPLGDEAQCSSMIGEFSINLGNLNGTGFVRSASDAFFLPEPVTLTPIMCPS